MRVVMRKEELEVLRGFIEEAWEHLDGIEDKILELEHNQDVDTVNAIFRPVHTIKGTAAFLGLNNIKELCHETETVLDMIRKGRLGVTSELIDLLLNAVDVISQMLRATEEALESPSEEGDEVVLEIADVDYSEVIRQLQEVKEGAPAEEQAPKEVAEPPKAEEPEKKKEEPKEVVLSYSWRPKKTFEPSQVKFPPGMKEQFLDEAEDHIQNIEDILLKFERGEGSLEDLNELFRSLHTLKGNAGVLLSTLEDPELADSHPLTPFKEVSHLAETLIQKRRDAGELPTEEEVDFLLKVVDVLKRLSEAVARDEVPEEVVLGEKAPERKEETREEGREKAEEAVDILPSDLSEARIEVLINTLSQALEAAKVGIEEILVKEKRQTALSKVGRAFQMIMKVAENLGEKQMREEAEKYYNIVDFLSKNEEPEEHERLFVEGIKEGFVLFEKVLEKLKELRKKEEPKPEERPVSEKKAPSAKPAAPSPASKPEPRTKQVIKVPQERLDKLMNLVGELVVTKNNFAVLARELSVVYNLPALAKKVKDFGASVSRIVDELQATIMSIRMVPVAQVFSRFPRMVRDLSRKLNKKVKLVITGEETELDKTIIEALGDPLVHLIRNAMDHGIEPPEERRARGKPEEGTIWLRAYNKGQSVIIEVEDDGRGIDPNKIRAKALEKGILSEEDLERLDDKQVINLIFQPGFSTADKVSEVSGRGVGMDVVRNAVEKIGGSVELESTVGVGTKVILKLPLTLAISKGLEVEVNGERYYIPLDYVVETVKAPRSAVHRHRNRTLVVIRDSLLPMKDLAEALGEPKTAEDGEEIPLVVLNLGKKKVALKVDRFYNESEFVLKPLVGPLENLQGFSGATVTGEGRIILVLDPPKLLRDEVEVSRNLH